MTPLIIGSLRRGDRLIARSWTIILIGMNVFGSPCVVRVMKKPLLASNIEFHQGIRIDKIPVEGIPGLLFVAATVITFFGGILAVREFLLITAIPGVIGAGILYYWHNQTRW